MPEEQVKSEAGFIAEFHSRIAALESSNAELKDRLDAAQRGGMVEPYPGFGAHVVHVMQKHHFHDRPDPSDASGLGNA